MFSRHFFRLAARSAVPSGRRLMSVKARTAKKAEASSLVLMGGILGGVAIYQVTFSATTDIAAVKKDIAAAIDAEFEKRGDGTSMAPTLVRLAWHASGTYSAADGTGGSNGAHMRFAPESEWGANAGLQSARDFLEPIKKKHPEMSYADLWTLAGATAIEEMGGPQIPWRPGRTDSPQPTLVPDGRLPAADSGCTAADTAHLRDIFGRMGFNDKEIVCLAGAHAVGRCHTEASGYWGPWTNAETNFSTEYFRLLLEEKWTLKKKHEGKKWTGPRQYENPDGTLMMLPADMTLVQEPAFRQHVEFYAKNEDAFNKDFATTFGKLLELGVPFPAVQKKNFIDETVSDVLSKVKGILGI